MHEVEPELVSSWGKIGNFWYPGTMDIACPWCKKDVIFTVDAPSADERRKMVAARAPCPRCKQELWVWAVDPGRADDRSQRGCKCLLVYPAPYRLREPIPRVGLVPDGVRRAYLQTVQIYNARAWGAAGTLCGRTLEAVISHLIPTEERKATLAELIKQVAAKAGLDKPLLDLSNALREGRNIAAHFDMEREVDEETAESKLNLVEYLLDYLYALPQMIDRLKRKLAPEGPGVHENR